MWPIPLDTGVLGDRGTVRLQAKEIYTYILWTFI